MACIGEQARLAVGFAGKARIWIGRARMGLVAAPLAAPVALGVAARTLSLTSGTRAGPGGSSFSMAGLGWKDLWLAQAWISVPSTEKCSPDI